MNFGDGESQMVEFSPAFPNLTKNSLVKRSCYL